MYSYYFEMVKRKSLYKGVYKCGNKFRAQIQTLGVQHYLGVFNTALEAAKAYDAHAKSVLGAKAKTNIAESDPSNLNIVLPVKRINRFGIRTYAGISSRENKTSVVSEDGSARNYFLGSPVEGATEEELSALLARVNTEDDTDSSELCLDSSVHSYCSVQITEQQYFAGVLSYDQLSHVYHWIGTWLISCTGRPKLSEFIKSSNYFEFHSDKVADTEALNRKAAYVNREGVVCGIIRPTDTCFRGFMRRNGSNDADVEAEFNLVFRPVCEDHGPVTKYDVSCASCLVESSSPVGEFLCDTGLLVLSRPYL